MIVKMFSWIIICFYSHVKLLYGRSCFNVCMDTIFIDPSLMQNQLTVTLMEADQHGVPILEVGGALGGEGWQVICEACSQLPGRTRVLDFSGVTHCQTSLDDASSFGRQLARQAIFNPMLPCHVLIAPGDLLFGLCRVVQMNLDTAGLSAAVFRSVGAALKWLEQENRLGGPTDPLSPLPAAQRRAASASPDEQDSTHSRTSPGPRYIRPE